MYKATIQFGRAAKESFQAETLQDLLKEIENSQDLDCLINMGWDNEDDQPECEKLMAFVKKVRGGQATIEDFKNLDIDLSVGRIRCLEASQE